MLTLLNMMKYAGYKNQIVLRLARIVEDGFIIEQVDAAFSMFVPGLIEAALRWVCANDLGIWKGSL